MSAYCLWDNLAVTDAVAFEEYKRRVVPMIEAFGGRYLAIDANPQVIEGDWRPKTLVVIEFPDMAAAKRWYESDEYRELKALRRSALLANAVFVEGM